MAKQDSATSVTLSTRFDEREMAILKQAAERKQWSLSQLIRVGAYEKAVNIVNATSPAAYRVRALISEILRQLFNATIMVRDDEPFDRDVALDDHPFADDVLQGMELYATTLRTGVLQQFTKAVRSLGAELAPMLADEFSRAFSDSQTVDDLIDPTNVAVELTVDSTERADPSSSEKGRKKKAISPKSKKRGKGRKES